MTQLNVYTAEHWQTEALANLDWGECPAPDDSLAPDHVIVVARHGRVQGRCALWWRAAPLVEQEATGVIGQYCVTGPEASLILLRAAKTTLHKHSVRKALGPMDRDTWHAHRWVTWSRGDAEFPREPSQPSEWVTYWREAGFHPFASYHSSVALPGTSADPRAASVYERLTARGLRIRPIDTLRFDEELAAIHDLSLNSFQRNLLFQPLPKDDFIALYRPFKNRFDTQASAIAEDDDGVAGFLFCYPAPPTVAQQAPRLVVKTLAVKPGRPWAGLGVLLADHVYRQAAHAGYGAVIHALMQDTNVSARIRANQAEVFRRYSLFVSPVTA